jgi:hypothetical protein
MGGAAKSGDLEFFPERKHLSCLKFSGKMVDKDTGSFNPLSENLSPCTFCPARIGNRKILVIMVKILPELCSDDMSEGIAVIMKDQLWFSCRTGYEIDQQRIRAHCPLVSGILTDWCDTGAGYNNSYGQLAHPSSSSSTIRRQVRVGH